MKKKLFVLLLVVAILVAAVPALASGGSWHWHGHGSGGHNGHVCAMTCASGRLDPIRCQCVGNPPGLDRRPLGRILGR